MTERWVPRCPNCGNSHIVVAPSPCNPNEATPEHGTTAPNTYCIECGHTYTIAELVYVRL